VSPHRGPRGGAAAVRGRLDDAVRGVDAPDVVFAHSLDGVRTIRSGGTAPQGAVPREYLRYELGSATKTLTGLLLADLVRTTRIGLGDPASAHLAPGWPAGPDPITLGHLITHTSGLPSLPADFFPQALPRWATNPYAGYPASRVVRSFLRPGPRRHAPGTRWRYSNFGVAALGHTLVAATGVPWGQLLADRVLMPLGLGGTALAPEGPGTDATGHRADGATPTPPLLVGGFQAAGAVRATPGDLLTFLEAHLRPPAGSALEPALRSVRTPVLRRGPRHRDIHTLTWFRHEAEHGPVLFHGGATSGQQAFLGFAPHTGAALAAVCTRRFRRTDALVPSAYAVLSEDPADW
jgi:CubicO group peptidase (beta-lactamase class C family)